MFLSELNSIDNKRWNLKLVTNTLCASSPISRLRRREVILLYLQEVSVCSGGCRPAHLQGGGARSHQLHPARGCGGAAL